MTKKYDAVIIGAGHNGLVCAFYLAQAGLKVRIVERRDIVGGAAVTDEFHPGFRNSAASYTVSLLQDKVACDMNLAEHGLKIVNRPLNNFLPLDGDYLKTGPGVTEAEVARFSAKDAAAFEANIATLRGLVAPSRICAVMKADAYGNGIALLIPSVILIGMLSSHVGDAGFIIFIPLTQMIPGMLVGVRGSIAAENRRDEAGLVTGARFTVRLPKG